jgi:sugar/nucleoside kinase (ribokinase family)
MAIITMTTFDILIPGSYFCDVIFTGLPTLPILGAELYTKNLAVVPGGVLNTIIALRRLGVHVGWLGAIGNDFFSQFVLSQAQSEGLDTSLLVHQDTPLQRVTVALSYPHERAFITYADDDPITAPILADSLDKVQFKHLHFTGLEIAPETPALLRRCHARGITVSMDCQHKPNKINEPLVQESLSLLDIFMPNASEAQQLTDAANLTDAASILTKFVPYLVVKDGSNGVHSWKDGAYYHHPALQLEVVDTVGAGDVFNAGFLAAYRRGYDVMTCLQWGNIAGGLSTRGHGGVSRAPQLEELLSLANGNTGT